MGFVVALPGPELARAFLVYGTYAGALLRSPPKSCGRNTTHPGIMHAGKRCLIAIRLYPGYIVSLAERRESPMSKDRRDARWPAAKLKKSERWGNPPIWSPWNFQSPNQSGNG
jgi:hypothetical protein